MAIGDFTTSKKVKKSSTSLSGNLAFRKYFRNVDYSKFKPDVPPMEIYEMLVWMTEGYLHDKRKSNASISIKEIMEKFYVWEKWLKQIAYKEEYQKTEA